MIFYIEHVEPNAAFFPSESSSTFLRILSKNPTKKHRPVATFTSAKTPSSRNQIHQSHGNTVKSANALIEKISCDSNQFDDVQNCLVDLKLQLLN